MATIGDILFKGAEALGIKTNGPEWVGLLSSDQAKAEIPTDNPAEALKAFKSNFMTFEEALENQGVVNRLTTSGGAMIKERLEKSFIKWMKESGVSSDELEELVRTKDVNPETKWQGIYSKILEAGKASVPPPKDGKTNHDLELMKQQHAAALRDATAQIEAARKEMADKENAWKREKVTGSLVEFARKNYPIAAPELVAEPFYRTLAAQLADEYEITLSTSGEIVLNDKSAPNTIATDPKTGQPLLVKNVLSTKIPADLLKKQDAPPTGVQTVVNGNGDTGKPVLNPTQQAAREEWLQKYPELRAKVN